MSTVIEKDKKNKLGLRLRNSTKVDMSKHSIFNFKENPVSSKPVTGSKQVTEKELASSGQKNVEEKLSKNKKNLIKYMRRFLTSTEIDIYFLLLENAKKNQDMETDPITHNVIAEKIGKVRNTIVRSVKILLQRKLIIESMSLRDNKDGNVYRIAEINSADLKNWQ
jgi:predicted transcriptional regulator